MYSLSISTSTKNLCVVIAKETTVLAGYNYVQERAHNQFLIPVVEMLFKKCRLSLKDIDCFGVDIGPGSFTGLRIGISAVKGLSLALNKPIVCFSSLKALAFNFQGHPGIICPVIDAKRQQVYSALYRVRAGSIERKGRYFLGNIEELLKVLEGKNVFTGDAAGLYRDKICGLNKKGFEAVISEEKSWYPQEGALAELTHFLFKKKKVKNSEEVSAMYLYEDTCTVRSKQ